MDKFDVSKVLTVVTKNQAVIGGEGWFADSLSTLEHRYRNNPPDKLKKIQDDSSVPFPFVADRGGVYLYFYPVAFPKENYADKQAKWVEENNIVIGRKVKIVRKPTLDESNDSHIWWNSEFDDMIGNVYPVFEVKPTYIGIDMSSTFIGVPYHILEVVPVIRTYTDNELNNLVGTVVMSKGWKIRRMITGKLASIDRISVDGQEMSANTLLENYTHIDGSPCGVEV